MDSSEAEAKTNAIRAYWTPEEKSSSKKNFPIPDSLSEDLEAIDDAVMQHLKVGLRKQITARVRELSPAQKAIQGEFSISLLYKPGKSITDQLLASEVYKRSKYISVFIHLPIEVPTSEIIADLLKPGSDKVCYVPKVDEKTGIMKMLRVYSMADLESFPKEHFRNFTLIEPPLDYKGGPREEALENGTLDLLICPGVAFDEAGGRMGRGKGYYDKFLGEWGRVAKEKQMPPPQTVGVGFHCQKIDEVPMASFDKRLDQLIVPTDEALAECAAVE